MSFVATRHMVCVWLRPKPDFMTRTRFQLIALCWQDSLKTDVSGNGFKHLTPISNSPDGEAEYDLRVVSMEILKYLSSLTMLYTAPPQDTQEKDTVEVNRAKVIPRGEGGTQHSQHIRMSAHFIPRHL